jgi:DNA-binding response OmpR family regulator
MLAWKPVQNVLDEIMIVPPGGLATTQYKELRMLRDRAKACARDRLRKLGDNKARRDKAIEHVAERLQALPEPPLPPAMLEFPRGAIVYRGHRERLSGKPWQVLKALAIAPGQTLSLIDILRTVWGNRVIGEEAVRRHSYTARKALRKALKAAGIKAIEDPIPVVDRGTDQTAWRLDLP